MKIRFDFVTNSSSSSFICFKITNEKLSEACQRHWIPIKYYGNTMESFSWSYGDGYMDVETPGGGSITDWFISILERMDFSYEKYCRKDDLIEYLKQNKEVIDSSTTSAIIDHHSIVSDDYGSCYRGEVRKGGKIISYCLDEEEWDSKEMGNPLWEELEGDCDRIREQAKKIGGWHYSEKDDPWMKKDVDTDIFTSSIDSVDQLSVCLTGDFEYGSKEKVEQYVISKGGSIVSSVSGKTNVLIVGNKGSDAWTFGNYGRKVEKAISLKEKSGIVIIKETDFFNSKLSIPEPITQKDSSGLSDDYSDFKIKVFKNNTTATLIKYTGKSANVIIPRKIGDVEIIKIGGDAFKRCTSLISVAIPEGVTEIGVRAFANCTNLKTVTIPNGVKKIDVFAFGDCENLTDVLIPKSVKEIERGAFWGCNSLTNLVMLNDNVELGSNVFLGCEGLADENGFVIVNNRLFGYFGNDNEVAIPEGVSRIEARAFDDCADFLDCINVLDNNTEIGDGSFGDSFFFKDNIIENHIMLRVKENSVAHKYALKEDIQFELI